MPQEPSSPRELRAQLKYYFANTVTYIAAQNEQKAAFHAKKLAHFGLRLLEHPSTQLELKKAQVIEDEIAQLEKEAAEEKIREEAEAAVVARLTGPQEG